MSDKLDLNKIAAYAKGMEYANLQQCALFEIGGRRVNAVQIQTLFQALPRLIELARIGQSVGELEDGEQLAILKPPREAEQWYIDPDDV